MKERNCSNKASERYLTTLRVVRRFKADVGSIRKQSMRVTIHIVATTLFLTVLGCTSLQEAEDEIDVPLQLTPCYTQDVTGKEAETILGLTGPIEVDDFSTGAGHYSFYGRIHDSANHTLTALMTHSNYIANEIHYDFLLKQDNNTLSSYSCGSGDKKFKAFCILCLDWINRQFPQSEHQRLKRGDLSYRATIAGEIISFYGMPEKHSLNTRPTNKQAAESLALTYPIEVTNFGLCMGGHLIACCLKDSKGNKFVPSVNHSEDDDRRFRGSDKQNEALRILCLDWVDRCFPISEDGKRYILRPEKELVANRILAFLVPAENDGLITISKMAGNKPFTGKVCTFYKNGKIKSETPYINGRHNGIVTSWHNNGQKESEYAVIEGATDGIKTTWYKNGYTQEVSYWRNSCMAGNETVWYPDGKKKRETFYDPDLDCVSGGSGYYPNGQKWFAWKWQDNGTEITGMWNKKGLPIPITNVYFDIESDQLKPLNQENK
jgi:antitoxin component YwqK of YwqJK toxin-antitoxin module